MLDQNINLYDEYRIFDALAHKMEQGMRGPLGWVQIFLQTKNGIVYDEESNLVVAQGREYVAQRVFNSFAFSGGSRTNWTSYVISHFAIGSGGSVVSESPPSVTLNGPYICDTRLLTPTSLGISGYLTEPSGTTLSVKPITASGGSVFLEAANYSGGGSSCSNYTKMKCTCIIPSGEPSSLSPGGVTKIDEAGLYFVSGSTAVMFAHVCFAPKWKEKESTTTLNWYILF